MPLSPPYPGREPIHLRQVECRGFRRPDGLWDIEGHIVDSKAYPYTSDERGHVAAGEPVHNMSLRLTVDDDLEIFAVEAVTDNAPFPATCPHVAPNYQRLVGLKIGPGFKRAVRERLGGVEGCTHLTELLGPVATTAFQTIFPIKARESGMFSKASAVCAEEKDVPLLNTCHGFRADGPVIKKYAPQAYTGKKDAESST